jgi:hypothetical protein
MILAENATVTKVLDPVSQSAGSPTTVWIPMQGFKRAVFILQVGAMTTNSTVDMKLQTAESDSGTGANDVTGAAITQLTEAGTDDNKVVAIDINFEEAVSDSDTHIGAIITVATAASLLSATCIRYNAERAAVTFASEETVIVD